MATLPLPELERDRAVEHRIGTAVASLFGDARYVRALKFVRAVLAVPYTDLDLTLDDVVVFAGEVDGLEAGCEAAVQRPNNGLAHAVRVSLLVYSQVAGTGDNMGPVHAAVAALFFKTGRRSDAGFADHADANLEYARRSAQVYREFCRREGFLAPLGADGDCASLADLLAHCYEGRYDDHPVARALRLAQDLELLRCCRVGDASAYRRTAADAGLYPLMALRLLHRTGDRIELAANPDLPALAGLNAPGHVTGANDRRNERFWVASHSPELLCAQLIGVGYVPLDEDAPLRRRVLDHQIDTVGARDPRRLQALQAFSARADQLARAKRPRPLWYYFLPPCMAAKYAREHPDEE